MNINDFKAPDPSSFTDRLEAIFARQTELMVKYHPIEHENGLLQTEAVPVDLHHRLGQARIKDFAWRTTEELAEAVDAAYEKGWQSPHAREEIADAFHFLVELAILAGLTPDRLDERLEKRHDWERSVGDKLEQLFFYGGSLSLPTNAIMGFIRSLGMTCHLLKNKPWKQSHMLTDIDEFWDRLAETFEQFGLLCLSIEMKSSELFDLYFRKSEVNRFRQSSNY